MKQWLIIPLLIITALLPSDEYLSARKKISISLFPFTTGEDRDKSEALTESVKKNLSGNENLVLSSPDETGQYRCTLKQRISEPSRISGELRPIMRPLSFNPPFYQTFTASGDFLSGIRIERAACALQTGMDFVFILMNASDNTAIRSVPVTFKPGSETVISFLPVPSSEGKNFRFTLVPADIVPPAPLLLPFSAADTYRGGAYYENDTATQTDILFDERYSDTIDIEPDSTDDKNLIKNIRDLDTDYVLSGSLEVQDGKQVADVFLYSAKDHSISFIMHSAVEDTGTAGFRIAAAVSRQLSGDRNPPLKIDPTRGSSPTSVFITWDSRNENDRYRILRSSRPQGPFVSIGESGSTSYVDYNTEPGREYWYSIEAFRETGVSDPSPARPGYRSLPSPVGEKIDDLLAAKKYRRPPVRDATEKAMVNSELAFLDKYYMNSIKLSLILFLGRSYLENGTITVLKDFDTMVMDRRSQTLYLIKNDAWMIRLFSYELFEFLDAGRPSHGVIRFVAFGKDGNTATYSFTGLGAHDEKGTWAEDGEVTVEMTMPAVKNDCYLDLEAAPRLFREQPWQPCLVYANGTLLEEKILLGREKFRVLIPEKIAASGTLSLKLIFPSACEPGKPSSAEHSPTPKVSLRSMVISEKFSNKELFERLMRNGLFFCIREEDRPAVQKDGTIKYLPSYEALGMTTSYYPESDDWRSSTVMIGTSNTKLVDEMKRIWKQGGSK